MKKNIKTICFTLLTILVIVYLWLGVYPFQGMIIKSQVKKYMNETYPYIEIENIDLEYNWEGMGYKIICLTKGNSEFYLRWDTLPFWHWGVFDLAADTYADEAQYLGYSSYMGRRAEALLSSDSYQLLEFNCHLAESFSGLSEMHDDKSYGKDESLPLWLGFKVRTWEVEQWTMEELSEKIWRFFKTLEDNSMRIGRMAVYYDHEYESVYVFSWDDSMGELTEDGILPLIKENGQYDVSDLLSR